MDAKYKNEVAKLIAKSMGWSELPAHYVPTPEKVIRISKSIGISEADRDRLRMAVGDSQLTGKPKSVKVTNLLNGETKTLTVKPRK